MATTIPLVDRDLTSGDRAFASTGDTAMVAGQLLVVQRLIRRAITIPGSIPAHPTFGCGLGYFAERTIDNRITADITGRVKAQFILDPAVVSVDRVLAQRTDAQVLLVQVQVTLAATYGSAVILVPVSVH